MTEQPQTALYEVAVSRSYRTTGVAIFLLSGIFTAISAVASFRPGAQPDSPVFLAFAGIGLVMILCGLAMALEKPFCGHLRVEDDTLTVFERGKPVFRCKFSSISSMHYEKTVHRSRYGRGACLTNHQVKMHFIDGSKRFLFSTPTSNLEELRPAMKLAVGSWEAWKAQHPETKSSKTFVGTLDEVVSER